MVPRTALAGRGPLGRPEISSRVWLAVFAVFASVAILAGFLIHSVYARDGAVADSRRSAQNLAKSLADQASETFEGIDAVLLTVSQQIENDGTAPAARIRLRDAMAALVTTMPRIHTLNYIDEHGRFAVNNISASSGWLPSAADRPYFQYHLHHPGTNLHISGPARSRIDDDWVIFASRRIERPDGSFAGVLVAPVALDYFDAQYAHVDIGRLGTIKLVADDGTVMARRPRKYIGQSVAADLLFADPYKFEMAASYIRSSPLDGVRRLVAFDRLGRFPLVVEVALAEDEYLAEARSDVFRTGVAMGIVLLTIGALAARLSAQIARGKRAEEDLARLALCDGLTGLANRRQFDAVVECEWRRAQRDRSPLGLLMIDVDHFKRYNDHYGHQRGDEALLAIAKTIALNVRRPSDTPTRYGGEEFAVILPGTDASSAAVVAERIRAAVRELAIPHAGDSNGTAGVSIGVASLRPQLFAVPAQLVDAADRALYDAKRAGRNRVAVAENKPGTFSEPPDAPLGSVLNQ